MELFDFVNPKQKKKGSLAGWTQKSVVYKGVKFRRTENQTGIHLDFSFDNCMDVKNGKDCSK